MKKLVTLFIATLLASSVSAQPDKDWWACQFVKAVGMKWENGRWVETNFKLARPFVLISDGNEGLTLESAAKAMMMGAEGSAMITTCETGIAGDVWCMKVGDYLAFNTLTGQGGITKLYGATMHEDERDTPEVAAFECTKG